jgi:hypothetical protein
MATASYSSFTYFVLNIETVGANYMGSYKLFTSNLNKSLFGHGRGSQSALGYAGNNFQIAADTTNPMATLGQLASTDQLTMNVRIKRLM